jgi:hypothetical protein
MTRPMGCQVYRRGETVALATWGSIPELARFVKWCGRGWFVEDAVRSRHAGAKREKRRERQGGERNLLLASLCSLLVGEYWVGGR